jgi:hypothetical protein
MDLHGFLGILEECVHTLAMEHDCVDEEFEVLVCPEFALGLLLEDHEQNFMKFFDDCYEQAVPVVNDTHHNGLNALEMEKNRGSNRVDRAGCS